MMVMTLELILIRHGETEWNKDRVFRGQMDMRLNATGIVQADVVADLLKDKVFDAIYTSPLKRAVVTARRIAKPHGIEIRETPGLSDMHFGLWQGLTEVQVKERFSSAYRKWNTNPAWMKVPGGETTRKAWKRINSQLREILFMHGTGTVVIVSHRVPLKMMTAYLLKMKRGEITKIKHDPCAISIFDVPDRYNIKAITLNDSSHLKRLDLPPAEDF
ncbi:MAG: histidine phosphatase family protein [Candidatus Thermoplasmatota archaeon]|nr:histidine phosphatase family protein [Candidatus Thermoplasmatota archaeon]